MTPVHDLYGPCCLAMVRDVSVTLLTLLMRFLLRERDSRAGKLGMDDSTWIQRRNEAMQRMGITNI